MHADQLRNDAKPTMVCSADDLAVWGDFPRGLRVLLLDEDQHSAEETRLKLEAMDYIVFSYYNEKDAPEAIRKKAESYHVAIIEATSGNCDQTFKFLEMTKDLPTIVISNVGCLSTMMKCIALGAAEVLEKPLSDDKLRNIWQHVVHKAFNAESSVLRSSLKPVKETVASMLRLPLETAEPKLELPSKAEKDGKGQEHGSGNTDTVSDEIFAAPSTPQLIHGGKLLDSKDCKQQCNFSKEKEIAENTKDLLFGLSYSDAKSVANTCNNLSDVITTLADSPLQNVSPVESNREDLRKENSHIPTESNASFVARENSHSYGSRGNIKRMKVDWTPELHRQFVKAVERLGIDQAIPSKILELMKVEGLTRHNVASHLQKFRMHKRHILPKDVERRCQTHREAMPRDYMQKPVMAFPPYFHQNYSLPVRQVHPAWSHPNFFTSGYQMWQYSGLQPWHPPRESWHFQSYRGINADAWGCPIYPPYSHCSQTSQNTLTTDFFAATVLKDSYAVSAVEEVIDEVVKEAMSKPWLPPPLGLKPPSTDSVLAELHRQGIRTVPPLRTATATARPRRQ